MTGLGNYQPSAIALPFYAPPPSWSVGSAHIALAPGRPVLTQGSFVEEAN